MPRATAWWATTSPRKASSTCCNSMAAPSWAPPCSRRNRPRLYLKTAKGRLRPPFSFGLAKRLKSRTDLDMNEYSFTKIRHIPVAVVAKKRVEDDKRARLLDAALDLFEIRGFDAVAVPEIAAKAGV